MTFSRHYAKARQAALKQQKNQVTPLGRQAQRIPEPPPPISLKEYGASLKKCFRPILLLVVVLAIAFGLWYERSELWLPIRHVNVEGASQRIDRAALQQVLNQVASHSMVSNLQALQRQLEALPWVQTVRITRQWPNRLHIYLTEVEPVARFNDQWFLSQAGTLLVVPNDKQLGQLPWFFGAQDQALFLWQAYRAMSPVLAPLGLSIRQLRLSPRYSYDVVLNNGLELFLGANQVMEHLQLFAKVYAQQIAPKLDQMAYVDLRYASSMAIGWKTPVAVKTTTAAAK